MKKRLISLFTAATLLVTALAACNTDTDKGDTDDGIDGEEARYEVDADVPAYKLDPKEDNKFTWYVNAEWWNTDWGNDTVTSVIQDDLNLDVEFIVGDDTKLNTFFASGELPDIITIFDGGSKVAKQADEWALPINKLAEKYDPYFFEVARQETLDWYTLEDGNVYGYPGYSNTKEDADNNYILPNTAFVIRKDVYEALGEPDMTTPENFVNTLKEIKAEFPDLIPFGSNPMTDNDGSLGADLQNYLGVPRVTEDGSWYDRVMDDDYQTWLRTLNHAYRAGGISDDNFSDDGTIHEEKVSTGQYATIFVGGTPQRSGSLQNWYSENEDAQYIAIDGPKSLSGNEPAFPYGLSGWPVTYITKQCNDPIKAIEMYTYLLTDEAGILVTYGVEGETYEVNEDGKIELLPEVEKMKQEDNDKFKKVYRLTEFFLFGHDRFLQYGDTELPAMEQINAWGREQKQVPDLTENIGPDEGTDEARNLSAIMTDWYNTIVSMIRADSDEEFDQLLEEHKQFREDNGWEDIVKVYNEKTEENVSKLS